MASYSDIIDGLKLLASTHPRGLAGHGVDADHDIIWAGDSTPTLSPADVAALEALGWHYDERAERWARFV
jgi:hypothetical protein